MRETNEFLKQSEAMVQAAQRKAGINSTKVQQTVSSYLQIARDNQLNYNELLQVLSGTKEAVLQSLNKVSLECLITNCTSGSKMETRLENIETCDLIAELRHREGVEVHQAEPYRDLTVNVNGPAVVLTVTD